MNVCLLRQEGSVCFCVRVRCVLWLKRSAWHVRCVFYMFSGGFHEDWHKARPLVVTYVRPGGPADRWDHDSLHFRVILMPDSRGWKQKCLFSTLSFSFCLFVYLCWCDVFMGRCLFRRCFCVILVSPWWRYCVCLSQSLLFLLSRFRRYIWD